MSVEKVKHFLKLLGIEDEEYNLYCLILDLGETTTTKLINKSQSSRYAVEKILEKLLKLKLITRTEEGKSIIYQVNDPNSITELLKERKEVLKKKTENINSIVKKLEQNFKRVEKNSKTIHYKGLSGLQQMMWNTKNAKEEIRLFEVQDVSPILNFGFYDEIRKEHARKGVHWRDITNEKKIDNWTNVKEFLRNWDIRYIDPKIIRMSVELMIYNDIYCLYGNNERGVWGVEIYNAKLAQMQKKLFDFMWKKGKKMKLLNEHGACELTS